MRAGATMTIETHYSVTAVTKALGNSRRTIHRWLDAGKIKAAELPGRFNKPSYALTKQLEDEV